MVAGAPEVMNQDEYEKEMDRLVTGLHRTLRELAVILFLAAMWCLYMWTRYGT